MGSSTYESDFYAWTQTQVDLLRSGKLEELDWENLVEEIESLGKAERRELEGRLRVIVIHLLKWQFQPALRSRSWQLTLQEQHIRLQAHLQDNPSLQGWIPEALRRVYPLAVIGAERETGLESFPDECPFTIEQILATDFFPT
ncbi:DUF29 domain-containing protein [Thermostichus vulcanus]|uniref:DUF29 domain-containing protein n=1 Tax=Thermostichus vulcanus str. 'Rupite' TaxID=2813851 RepID=A0ABT0C8R5_THEVL|nr:DUF29 domain-containing protein [Thermostichus vulcanus]MCJ2542181.1 DUF29 domain-containing protein [Thermostichus vulcanus str. 'Rupite']